MFVGKNQHFEEINFLASDKTVPFSMMIDADNALATVDEVTGHKIIKAGTPVPANDATAQGILLDSVDLTEGPQMAAVLRGAWVYTKRLPVAVDAAAKTAMTGIHFIDQTDAGDTSDAGTGDTGSTPAK
ncbi:hypothetical protein OXT66_03255 [Lentilactobacillus senioris]|uniref:hypothetical protein n=1 Tax=Lentilactobacillus senioris TaxID=931534 RepID=UPI0022819C6C|nr:hypothetical protein [Lentilactobacillus senioris]MCY9806567.1 hypothetical protein [Lentilactobacillus senioris]